MRSSGPAASRPLPARERREPRLAPHGAGASRRVDPIRSAPHGLEQAVANGVEVLGEYPLLDTHVGLAAFVERVGEVAVDRPRVDAGVDAQQREPDAIEI